MAQLPGPFVQCVLPDYADEHQWWLIFRYLQDAGFQHTASAFQLELNLRGVADDKFEVLSKVSVRLQASFYLSPCIEWLSWLQDDLRKHYSLLITKILAGCSLPAAVNSARAAGHGAGKGLI